MGRLRHKHDFCVEDTQQMKIRKQQKKEAKKRVTTRKRYSDQIRRKRSKKTNRIKSKSFSTKKSKASKKRKTRISPKRTSRKSTRAQVDEIQELQKRCHELQLRHLNFVLRGNPTQLTQVQQELDWIAQEKRDASLQGTQDTTEVDTQHVLDLEDSNRKFRKIISIQDSKIQKLRRESARTINDRIERRAVVARIETCVQILTHSLKHTNLKYLGETSDKQLNISDMTLEQSLKRLENISGKCEAQFQQQMLKRADLSNHNLKSYSNAKETRLVLDKAAPKIDIDTIIRESKQIESMTKNGNGSAEEMSELALRVSALDNALKQSQDTIDALLNSPY